MRKLLRRWLGGPRKVAVVYDGMSDADLVGCFGGARHTPVLRGVDEVIRRRVAIQSDKAIGAAGYGKGSTAFELGGQEALLLLATDLRQWIERAEKQGVRDEENS